MVTINQTYTKNTHKIREGTPIKTLKKTNKSNKTDQKKKGTVKNKNNQKQLTKWK